MNTHSSSHPVGCTGLKGSRAVGSALKNKLQPAGTQLLKEGIGQVFEKFEWRQVCPKKEGKNTSKHLQAKHSECSYALPHYCSQLKTLTLAFFHERNTPFGEDIYFSSDITLLENIAERKIVEIMINNGHRLIVQHIISLEIICKTIHSELLDEKYFKNNFTFQVLS